MEAKSDTCTAFNVTTLEETRNGTFTIRWVIEDDGQANGWDEKNRRWEALWTGESIIEARKIK